MKLPIKNMRTTIWENILSKLCGCVEEVIEHSIYRKEVNSTTRRCGKGIKNQWIFTTFWENGYRMRMRMRNIVNMLHTRIPCQIDELLVSTILNGCLCECMCVCEWRNWFETSWKEEKKKSFRQIQIRMPYFGVYYANFVLCSSVTLDNFVCVRLFTWMRPWYG